MITLYMIPNTPAGVAVAVRLKEMLVAHKVVRVVVGETPPPLKPDTPLPAIVENEQIVSGETALETYLKELERDTIRWSWFQSDSCYIDPDGETC